MKKFSNLELVKQYAQLSRRWCMLLVVYDKNTSVETLRNAAPCLKNYDSDSMLNTILSDYPTVLTFGTEDKLLEAFTRIDGEYIYVITISNTGELMSENV